MTSVMQCPRTSIMHKAFWDTSPCLIINQMNAAEGYERINRTSFIWHMQTCLKLHVNVLYDMSKFSLLTNVFNV